MKQFEAEMRGRLMLLELMLGVTIAHAGALTDRPDVFCKQVMENVETMLLRQRGRADGNEGRALDFALASFKGLSEAMLRHVVKEGPTVGNA